LYNTDNPLHQRAAMARNVLDMNGKMTVADAIDLALCTQVYNAELWQARLAAAWEKASAAAKSDAAAKKLYDEIVRWNRRADADSTGAIAYKVWKDQFAKIKGVPEADRAGVTPPEVPADKLVQAVADATAELNRQWG